MKVFEDINDIDVENKTYIMVNNWGIISILKHFTIIDCNSRPTQRWRFVTMDGRKIFNILINKEDIPDAAFMYENPQEAFKSHLSLKNPVFYECDNIMDFIQNAHKVIKEEIN